MAFPLTRKAFELAALDQWSLAAEKLQPAVTAAVDLVVRGYLKQQLAEFTPYDSPVEAQKILLSGPADNPQILRPLAGITYKRIPTATRSQGEASEDFVRAQFIDPNGLVLWTKALLADLAWDPDKTSKFEAAIHSVWCPAGGPRCDLAPLIPAPSYSQRNAASLTVEPLAWAA